MFPDPDYDRGVIHIKSDDAAAGVQRIFQIPRGSKIWEVVEACWQVSGLSERTEETNFVNWLGTVNAMTL